MSYSEASVSVGLAVLVLLAGCGGVVQTAEDGLGSDTESYPETVSGESYQTHSEQLNATNTFVVEISNEIRVVGEDTTQQSERTERRTIALSERKEFVEITERRQGDMAEFELYINGTTGYAVGVNGTNQPAIYDNNLTDGQGISPPSLDRATGGTVPLSLNYTRNGTEQLNGVTTAKYTAEADASSNLTGTSLPGYVIAGTDRGEPEELHSLTANVWLDESGMIRQATVEYTVEVPTQNETVNAESTYRIVTTDVDGVTKPDWTANATALSSNA